MDIFRRHCGRSTGIGLEAGGGLRSKQGLISSGRNALVIGPLLLMGFVLVLWYAFNRGPKDTAETSRSPEPGFEERREQLLNAIAELDHRHEMNAISQSEFLRQREESKRQLRRISLLLKM